MTDIRQIGQGLALTLREGQDVVRWISMVFGSLARMTSGCVSAATLSFVMSQILLLVALILPWKLLIFLSSGEFPATLPHFLAGHDSRELVVTLSATALLAFLAHVLFDLAFGVLVRRGAHHILNRHRKTGLFGDQQSVAADFYRHILRVFAGTMACGLVMATLASIYPLMLFALVACLLIGLAGVAIWRHVPLEPERRLTPGSLGRFWLGGGFLFLAGWIVADYWRGNLPPLTVAFICLFLTRQALIFSAQSVQSLQILARQRSRVDALFLADMPWIPGTPVKDDFQKLLAQREQWVGDLGERYDDQNIQLCDIQMRMAEAGRLAYLSATTDTGEKAFLIKLFHRSLGAHVQHELEVMSVAASGWPAPRLVRHSQVGRHPCLVFEWDQRNRWLDRSQRSLHLSYLRSQLLDCSLPADLVCRYDRSRPHLARRLEHVDWNALRALVTSDEMVACCALVEAHWPELLAQISRLPRQLVLPALAGRMMAAGPDDAPPVLCNWSRWRWEPVGSGWPITPEGRKALQSTLAAYTGPRKEVAAIDGEMAYRAALLHETERCLSKSNPAAALTAVKRLHDSMVDHGVVADVIPAITSQGMAMAMRDVKEQLPC